MPFQFYCPQGHLLEGHESQSGQQAQCPYCQSIFVVPSPQPASAAQSPETGQVPAAFDAPEDQVTVFPNFEGEAGHEEVPAEVQLEGQAEDPDRVIHIICPEGHELPTPMSMVNQDAMCPHCGTLFRLRYQDSKEAEEDRKRERERREQQFAKRALNMAIVAAVLVGVAILGMIFLIVHD